MSAKRPTLAILTHSTDNFWQVGYLVQLMIPRWEAMGYRVVVVTEAGPFVPADIALLHVDLSVVPEATKHLAARYAQVLNGRVLDIRKRQFSQLIIDRQGPYNGSVIVKTDWNYGGWREFRGRIVQSPIGPLLRRFGMEESMCHKLQRVEALRSWRRRRMLNSDDYRVYVEPGLVPGGVWRNPNLIVERFVAERDGSDFCCRHWLFFGAQEVHKRTLSPSPVVKIGAARKDRLSSIERIADPIPEELRTIRERMGFDYGKFDYGIVDGKVFLYDVNRTPGASSDPRNHAETIEVLSEGLQAPLSL